MLHLPPAVLLCLGPGAEQLLPSTCQAWHTRQLAWLLLPLLLLLHLLSLLLLVSLLLKAPTAVAPAVVVPAPAAPAAAARPLSHLTHLQPHVTTGCCAAHPVHLLERRTTPATCVDAHSCIWSLATALAAVRCNSCDVCCQWGYRVLGVTHSIPCSRLQ